MTRAEAIKCIQEDGINLGAGDFVDVEALKVAVECMQEQERSEWISVEDRLPEDLPENEGRKVIQCIVALKSCYPNGKATIQKRQRQVLYDYDWNPCGWEWSRIGKSRVTHWMPLPEPPKEGSE